jgi:cytidylate kinase
VRPRGLVIAIDGPSGAGKSTAGRALAAGLGYTFVDTGAMYRALALAALRLGLALDAEDALARLARERRIELHDGGRRVSLDGEDVTDVVRTPEVSRAASHVSVYRGVRREMVRRQQELGAQGGVVLDGRDIGTAVFPDAEVKFYVDADPGARARRRHAELTAAGPAPDLDQIERDIRARDHKDQTRADSPLVRAPDAILLDTTTLTPDEVLERMRQAVAAAAARLLSSERR